MGTCGNETDTMIGYHAVSVIADAMAKNIKGFDYEKAFEAAKHSAELNHFGLEAYKKRGYISSEDEQESVSKTLEYAYNDFCIAQMAKILAIRSGDVVKSPYTRDLIKYLKRAQSYKNLFDKQTGFMRPKQNGNWIEPFAPNEVTFHFTEGNSVGFIRFSCRTTFRDCLRFMADVKILQKNSTNFFDRTKTRRTRTARHYRLDRAIRARQRAFASHRIFI